MTPISADDFERRKKEEEGLVPRFESLFADYVIQLMSPGTYYDGLDVLKFFNNFCNGAVNSEGLTEKVERLSSSVSSLREYAKSIPKMEIMDKKTEIYRTKMSFICTSLDNLFQGCKDEVSSDKLDGFSYYFRRK